ncbi:uncharacterized protein LOC133198419 [Saccostrea echinata]|uniref:uncharacterized protein LOC133198419 n=1 Tax=Saccostrea echinata TaxID=191078 RepID=UPI002A8019F4|nr:uncharacterized protein LOC133198419 [Saccostrea echinata]
MKFFIFFTILITISKAISDSLLTGTYDPNSTVLINERRDIKEIDVLRQIINQETLIRLGVVKDVKSLMEDVKRRMEPIETMVSSLEQTVETLKYQVNTITQENNRNAFIPQGRLQEWDQMIKTMNENITDIYEYLTTGKGDPKTEERSSGL